MTRSWYRRGKLAGDLLLVKVGMARGAGSGSVQAIVSVNLNPETKARLRRLCLRGMTTNSQLIKAALALFVAWLRGDVVMQARTDVGREILAELRRWREVTGVGRDVLPGA
ncbi:MAG: hypothetical protein DRJ96_10095 [Thermoprotei archaeon]|nr:MAG: hypothetical protein DRJ67_10080 [Thermoprotei archaeon]RLE93450.1 MAG: hypothetical protein DRJ96_10095 [Thermoprotei archaeon]